MLNCSTNPTFLVTTDIGRSDNAGQVRVLGEELKALRDVVSTKTRRNKGIALLYHRGGSEERKVRSGMVEITGCLL